MFLERLATAEDEDHWYLAGLAARLAAWPLLEQVVRQAGQSRNPEVREIAVLYTRSHGPMFAG